MAVIKFVSAALLTFLSLHQLLIEGVEYEGPMTGDDFDLLSSDAIMPFDPLSSDADTQFDHFEHFTHYLSKRQATPDSTATAVDDHDYYTSKFYPPGPEADGLWVDLNNISGVEKENLAHNISGRYRYFAVHGLMFDFPIYGHTINAVAITTGGFIYVGTYLHQFIHLTQYIAPLQADFNPGLNESATVLVYSTEDQFTIQWDEVHNHDHVSSGTFTFQLRLFKSGVIHFVYREIPLLVTEISDENHPVEVGLSDSFYVDTPLEGSTPGILRTIYEYHRIQLNASDDLANSAYVITPLPNCIMASSCDECVNITENSLFQCGWCETLNRCSDGIDRHRQEWFLSGCIFTRTQQCEVPTTASAAPSTNAATSSTTTSTAATPTTTAKAPTTSATTTTKPTTTAAATTVGISTTTEVTTSTTSASSPTATEVTSDEFASTTAPVFGPEINIQQQTGNQLSTGTITGVVVIICLMVVLILFIVGVVGVLVYGYRHPTSNLGQLMIKYRPKGRSLNKTSASYNVESGKAKLTDNYYS